MPYDPRAVLLPDVQVLERIAAGAFATVYKVEHQGRIQALKVMRAWVDRPQQQPHQLMFFREALAQKACAMHE